MTTYEILKWLHILAVVYWLGGEWGVFQTSYNVVNPKLPLAERMRHMETAYRIDILARTGILLLVPLGLHMGYYIGAQPLGGGWIVGMWIFFLLWLSLTWKAFVDRGTEQGLTLTRWDERIRYVVIPLLFIFSGVSIIWGKPFTMKWYATKILIFGILLVIGLILRVVMRHWEPIFATLARDGEDPALQAQLDREIAFARGSAYVYWILIATNAWLGVAKPF